MVLSGIVDDVQPGFIIYSGNQWIHLNRNSNYNRTITECQVETPSSNSPPSFSFSFYGTAVNIYGGPITSNTTFNYGIDSAILKPASINFNAIGKIGANIWSLTDLTAGQHTLQIVPTAGLFSLDYITFTPTTLTTSVTNNLNVAFDDGDSSVQFAGNWSKSTSVIPGGIPYEGTRTGSSTEGDTMKVQFIGSSISVTGLLNQNPGKLSASFSVDGAKATNFSPFDGDQDVNASAWSLSQQFYHQNLSPGEHSLLVTVQQATGSQALWIDSVVFGATSNTSINPAQSTAGNADSGLSNKKIIGIVAGSIFALIAILSLCNRHQNKKKKIPLSVNHGQGFPASPLPPLPPPPPISQSYYYFPIVTTVNANETMSASNLHVPMPQDTQSPSTPSQFYRPDSDQPPQMNMPFRTTAPPQQDGSYMPVPRSDQNSMTPTPPFQRQDWNPTSLTGTSVRPPSPPQQDGSDGIRYPAPDHVGTAQDSHLSGSESFTQVKPHSTVLTYHLTPQTGAHNSHENHPANTVTEPSDDPPPYNPYEE